MTGNNQKDAFDGKIFALWELALCVVFRDTAILDEIKVMQKNGMTNEEIFWFMNAVLRERGRRL